MFFSYFFLCSILIYGDLLTSRHLEITIKHMANKQIPVINGQNHGNFKQPTKEIEKR